MPTLKPLPKMFFSRDVDIVARGLIGATLTFGGVGGIIVETESYDPTDPASHSFGRRLTKRNAVMFGAPGHAYVYFIYGMYWCLNFVCGDGSAVLIRALEPRLGLAKMQARRGTEVPALLCSGPGRLCQALAIGEAQNGLSLYAPPFALYRAAAEAEVLVGPRIGLTKGALAQRRYGLARSRFVSRRFPDA